jgi:hypothetical protein
MPITKSITLESGLVVTHHKVVSIAISNATGQERVVASIASWVDKTFADNNPQTPAYRLGAILSFLPQPGMYALAEAAVVADSTCPLFGGTVAADVVLTDLESAKTRKRLEIESAKNVEMYADKTTSLGTFGSTESDNNKLSIAIQITQLAEAAGEPATCGYKDANGVWSTYTLAQLSQIALEMAGQVLPLYAKESDKFAEIEAATDVATVEAIGW